MEERVVNPKEVITKYDQLGCFIQHIGVLISEIDKFADEKGNIKIKDLNTAIDLFFLVYNHFKQAYSECLGREFVIEGDSTFAKLAKLLITILESLEDKKDNINP